MQLKRHTLSAAIKNTGMLAVMTTGLAFATSALAAEPNPYMKDDDSWISISGEVEDVRPDRFTLDYGDGEILVHMDDGDRDADGYKLLSGDEVTVYGLIDDDFFSATSINASSVYVKNIGTTFRVSAFDSDNGYLFDFASVYPVEWAQTTVRGIVTEVEDDEFVLNTGNRALRVEVEDMDDNPLDDEGYLKVTTGDYVMVVGELDDDLFEGRELEADYVVKPYRNW